MENKINDDKFIVKKKFEPAQVDVVFLDETDVIMTSGNDPWIDDPYNWFD